jgi:hypothetical protein
MKPSQAAFRAVAPGRAVSTLRKSALAALALAGAVYAPLAASAAGNDELWEVSTQMNIPGMPAGMGGMKQQVCQDKDPRKQGPQGKDMENCKVTDVKESGTRFTISMTCPQGKAVIDQTFNAARTEYKGTMKMTTRDGDMTMNMSGRKIGACDAQQARKQQDAKMAALKAQGERAQADAMANIKKSQDQQIQECGKAVETMDMNKLGVFSQCKQKPQLCKAKSSDEGGKRVATACNANQAEFCKRYQTQEGFLKAKGDERAAQMCGLSAQKVKASLCPRAAQSESLAFVARFCPAEAKPLAQKYCAGRDYTSMQGGKYASFCQTYLSNKDLEDSDGERKPQAAARKPESAQGREPEKKSRSEPASEGISKGLDKLKGLFGR